MIEIGQIVDGKYRIEQLVGRGGMGSVYAATHLVIGRRVALKVLHVDAGTDLDIVRRFEREAQAAARIGNDHILDVIDFGSLPDGSRYMVCEFLEGETLSGRLQRVHRLTPAEIIPIARQLLNGLSAAHDAGVVHRDLKPENLFLLRHKAGWGDFVKIIDFGISKFQATSNDEGGMRMTATGVVMGTPYYLSPEQARGTHDADQRSDLYSVGVILYEASTGELPFSAQNFNDLLFKIVLETPRPAHETLPELDRGFSELIMRAMAREPKDRFQSADEFQGALEAWAESAGLSLTGPVVTSDKRRRQPSSESLQGTRAPTPASWGGTQPGQPSFLPKPRRTGLIAAIALGGVFLTVGLAYGVHAALSNPGDQKPATSSQPSASVVAPPPLPPEVVPEPSPPPQLSNDFPIPEPADVDRFAEAGGPGLVKPQRTVRVNRPLAAKVPAAPVATSAPADTARVAPSKRVDALGY